MTASRSGLLNKGFRSPSLFPPASPPASSPASASTFHPTDSARILNNTANSSLCQDCGAQSLLKLAAMKSSLAASTTAPSSPNITSNGEAHGLAVNRHDVLLPPPAPQPSLAHALRSLNDLNGGIRPFTGPPSLTYDSPYSRSIPSTAPGSPRMLVQKRNPIFCVPKHCYSLRLGLFAPPPPNACPSICHTLTSSAARLSDRTPARTPRGFGLMQQLSTFQA